MERRHIWPRSVKSDVSLGDVGEKYRGVQVPTDDARNARMVYLDDDMPLGLSSNDVDFLGPARR
jgi:hypothetical protein